MRGRETGLQMATRHVAEQEGRIERQLALVARLDGLGISTEAALDFLASMRSLLIEMNAHVARLSQ